MLIATTTVSSGLLAARDIACQFIQEGTKFAFVFFARADEDFNHNSCAIDNDRLWNRLDRELFGDGSIQVHGDGRVQFHLFEEPTNAFFAFLQVDEYDFYSCIVVLSGQLNDLRHRSNAGAAPCCPEVQDEYLPFKIG